MADSLLLFSSISIAVVTNEAILIIKKIIAWNWMWNLECLKYNTEIIERSANIPHPIKVRSLCAPNIRD